MTQRCGESANGTLDLGWARRNESEKKKRAPEHRSATNQSNALDRRNPHLTNPRRHRNLERDRSRDDDGAIDEPGAEEATCGLGSALYHEVSHTVLRLQHCQDVVQ